MKRGPVFKLIIKIPMKSKKFDNDMTMMTANYDIDFFHFLFNLASSGSQIPDKWFII